ncbi:MAG TPA: TIGR02206 family membrane protein [Rhizomicrobium sp.]|nr:TIGR02206 family membrane protein [Rhizomicrobium sp.]
MSRAFVPFVPFSSSHIAVMVLTVAMPAALALIALWLRSARFARAVSLAFAAALIATWILWYWLIAARSWISLQTTLPMELCDWAAITTIATLIWPNQKSYELAYFWALSGTLQALVTPELYYDFPDLRFIVFFAFHGGTIAAVLFLTLARAMRPWPSSLPRVIAWSLVYMVSALVVNWLFGTNFGYLNAKPTKPSLLDVMGPWPIYIFELIGLGILYVFVLYAPFFAADRFRKRRTA